MSKAYMKYLYLWLVLLTSGLLHSQRVTETSVLQKFIAAGTVRLHLASGGYTISPVDSENIVVTCHADTKQQLTRIKVEIKPIGETADVYISETPGNNFQATIEVPRHSNLWARLSAGELDVEGVDGDKNLEILSGRIQIDIPRPELYGHRDARVMAGSIEAPAFDVSTGGLFRSFEQQGPGRYRLHARVITGEIDMGRRIGTSGPHEV
jgi:hypothetical protein